VIVVFGTVKKQTKCDKSVNVTNIDIHHDEEASFQNGAQKGFSDGGTLFTALQVSDDIISMAYLLTSDKYTFTFSGKV